MHPDPQDEYLAELYERYGARRPQGWHERREALRTADASLRPERLPVARGTRRRRGADRAWATRYTNQRWGQRPVPQKDGTIDRSRALYALALRMAADGGTAAEFKWHGCDNRDNAITDCPQLRSNPEHWFWRNCGDHVEWGKEENVLAYFEDSTYKNEEEMQSVQLPVLSMLRPKVLNAGNVADFLGKEIPRLVVAASAPVVGIHHRRLRSGWRWQERRVDGFGRDARHRPRPHRGWQAGKSP